MRMGHEDDTGLVTRRKDIYNRMYHNRGKMIVALRVATLTDEVVMREVTPPIRRETGRGCGPGMTCKQVGTSADAKHARNTKAFVQSQASLRNP